MIGREKREEKLTNETVLELPQVLPAVLHLNSAGGIFHLSPNIIDLQ